MPHPYMVDSSGGGPDDGVGAFSTGVAYGLEAGKGVSTLTVSADAEWLASAVYPVYIDPSITLITTAQVADAFVSRHYPTQNFGDYVRPDLGYHELWLGQDPSNSNNYAHVYFKFDLSEIDATTIDEASLMIYPYHQYQSPRTSWVGRATGSWTESGITWNNQPGIASITSWSTSAGSYSSVDVTGTVQSWASGSLANNGFRIHENNNNYTYWKRLLSSEHSSGKPRLIVAYHVPSATPTDPTAAEWVNGRLLKWSYSDPGGHAQSHYQVQVDNTSNFSSPTASSGTVASSAKQWSIPAGVNLSNGTTYYWRVKVKDGTSWSNWSSAATFTWDGAAPSFTSATVGGAITAEDPNHYDLGDGTFTVKIRGTDAHSGIERTILRLTGGGDGLTAYHDWSGGSTNCTVSDPSTLYNVTACSRTYNSGGTREVQFTVVGLGASVTADINYALTDVAGNRRPDSGYTDTGTNLVFDATAPTSAITSPAAGNTVSGSVPILGAASDANFTEYRLHYESALEPGVWNPIGTNPYTTPVTNGTLGTWDATALADGAYTVRLRVYDKARPSSGYTQVLRPVTLANGTPVTADITSPLESSVIEGVMPISGTASATSDFDRYELLYGEGCDPASWADIGVNPRTTPVTEGVLADWDTTGLAGDHTIRLTVYQLGGAEAQDSVCVHVGPRLPEVALTSPSESAVLFSTEELTATATHESGIALVEFLVDGDVVGTDATEPFSVAWATTSVGDGPHSLEARATAVTDEVASSFPIVLTVDNGLAIDERVEADYESGRLSIDEYATAGIHALGAPHLLDERYRDGVEIDEGTTSAVAILHTWDELSAATRDEITAFLSQPMRGALFGATDVVDEGLDAIAAEDQPAVEDDCVRVERGPFGVFGRAWKCAHDTAHFRIFYTLAGSGDFEADTISETPDDVGADTFVACMDPIGPQNCNGVPDQIDRVAQGLEDAYVIYTDPGDMGFDVPWVGRTTVIIRGNLSGGQVMPNLNPLEDAETIEIGRNSTSPYYLAHHELFHVFQYSHIVLGSLLSNQVLGLGPWWWMEATADWAAGYVARSGDHGDSAVYAQSLPRFLGVPDARIDTFEHPHQYPFPRRQYGAFIFAEYLAEHIGAGGPGQPSYNAGLIRETWEAIGNLAAPQAPVIALRDVASDYGTDLGAVLPEFARANYLLAYDDAIGGGVSDVETVWRQRLDLPASPTASDDLGPARPRRDRYEVSDGQRVEGTLAAYYGGATYVEVVPPASTTGTLLVDVSGAQADAVDVRVMTLDYRLPPADPLICDDTQLAIDASGIGVRGVGIDGGCTYAVVIFTGLLDDIPQTFDWGAQFIATPDQANCVESFARTVAPGDWGMSELGVPWVSWEPGGSDPQASVNGTAGVYAGSAPSRMAAEDLPLDLPLELLVRWRFTGTGAHFDHYFQVSVQDADTGRAASGSYHRQYISGTDFSKTAAEHAGTAQVGTAAYAAPDDEWMWMRMLVSDDQTRLRVWPDGQAEPAVWQRTITGQAFTSPPDAITIFSDGTDPGQGVEVDSITIDAGCLSAVYTDPFDRLVGPQNGPTGGWGIGPLGQWLYSSGSWAGTWEVDGNEAIHTAAEAGSTFTSLHAQSLFGLDSRTELELLVKLRIDPSPADNSWSFEAFFSDGLGISSEYAGVGLAGFGTDDTSINAGLTYAAASEWFNSAPGYPRPVHGKDIWLRLLVDEFGVHARVWEDGQPEPVTTGGVVPSVGGRGEHWNTYELNEAGIPPMAWRYVEIRTSGGADTTRLDSLTVILP